MLVALLFALAVAVPPVPPGARDGEVVEIDGKLYEVVGDALWPLDENGQRIEEKKDAPQAAAVDVTGSHLDTSPSKAVVKTEAITATEIAERGATDLAEVLDQEAGIGIQSSQGLGKEVSLDGMDARHVLILVDGRPVNGKVDNRVDVSRIPVSASTIERIEVVRGPMSAVYGSEALGGVINIITKRPKQGLTGEAELSSSILQGGVLWNSLSLHGGGGAGPIAGRIDVVFDDSPATDTSSFDRPGDGELVVHPSRPDGQDDTADRRATQVVGEVDFFATESWVLRAQGQVELAEASANLARAVPFRQMTQTTETALSTTIEGDVAAGHQLVLDFSIDRFTHRFENDPFGTSTDPPAFCVDASRPTFRPFDDACAATPVLKSQAQQDLARAEVRYTGTLLTDLPAVKELSLSAGLVGARERWERENGAGQDTIPGGGQRATAATYAEILWRPLDFLAILPGGRVDVFMPGAGSDPVGVAAGPKIAARLDLPLGFGLRASYGQGFRLPSFQELFLQFDHSELGYIVEGNPALLPESSHGVRAEALWQLANFSASVEGFTNLVDNLITEQGQGTNDSGIPIFTYANAAHATTAGLNASVGVKRLWGFSLDVGYQWLPVAIDAANCPDENPWFCAESEGAVPLPLRPAHDVHGRFGYDVRATSTSLYVTGDFMSERPFGDLLAPPALLIGVGVRQPIMDHAEVTVGLANLLDWYDPLFGPKPGRHATLSLRGWF